GFPLRQAENGEEAVALAEAWRPHFIWMDIRMPVMDGYTACTLIKSAALDPEPVIVALTASTFAAEESRAKEAGCTAIIHKPYREQEIFQALARYLDVQYLYETEAENGDIAQSMLIGAADLAALPTAVRGELSEALIQLDTARMDELVNAISAIDEPLARRISGILDRFEYEALLEALDQVRKV
ncbi:MAG: response regulator, partial [Candidatus Promineifilaceae bacterium]|nr:response regulator [Candidatus Promineifilaceae bacterium]